MIGRFFYHAFWNFYDYLGTLTFTGIASGFVLFSAVLGLSTFGAAMPQAFNIVLFATLVIGIASAILAGLLNFTGKAARDEAARWPDFRIGVKQNFWRILAVAILWSLVQTILLFILWFYMQLGYQASVGRIGRILLLGAAGLVGWLAVTWLLLLPPWLAIASANDPPRFFVRLKQALVALVVCPMLWIIVGLCISMLLVAAWYLPFFLIFLVPLLASLSQTAFFLTQQHYQFMAEASASLPPGAAVRAIKKQAYEIAEAWEARQPRRTMKELFKPWQM